MTKARKPLRYALLLIIVVALLACFTLSLCACDDKDGGKDTDENVSEDYIAILNFIDSSIGYSKENNAIAFFSCFFDTKPNDNGIHGTYGVAFKSKTDEYKPFLYFIHFKDNVSAVAYSKKHDASEILKNSSVTVSNNFLCYEVDGIYDKIKQCSLPEGVSDSPEYKFLKKSLSMANSKNQYDGVYAHIEFGFDNDNKLMTRHGFNYSIINSNLSEYRECLSKAILQYVGEGDAEWNYRQTSVSEFNESKSTKYTDGSYCYMEDDVLYLSAKELPYIKYEEHTDENNEIYYSAERIYDYYDNVTTFTIPSTYKSKPVEVISFNSDDILDKIITLQLSTNIRRIDYIYTCTNLKTVRYDGTVAQWHEIEKRESDFANITVICKDGRIEAESNN